MNYINQSEKNFLLVILRLNQHFFALLHFCAKNSSVLGHSMNILN